MSPRNGVAAATEASAVSAPAVGVVFLLSQLGAHAAHDFADRLRGLDLKPYDAGILRMLGSSPGMTQQKLSATLRVFPSRLVRFLDELEARKLIERRDSPTDRRVYLLHLTRAGRAALASVGKIETEMEAGLLEGLNEAERERLQKLLIRIASKQDMAAGVHPAFRQMNNR